MTIALRAYIVLLLTSSTTQPEADREAGLSDNGGAARGAGDSGRGGGSSGRDSGTSGSGGGPSSDAAAAGDGAVPDASTCAEGCSGERPWCDQASGQCVQCIDHAARARAPCARQPSCARQPWLTSRQQTANSRRRDWDDSIDGRHGPVDGMSAGLGSSRQK
jgi:hypothetical protein